MAGNLPWRIRSTCSSILLLILAAPNVGANTAEQAVSDVTIQDQYFFVGQIGHEKAASLKATNRRVVRKGECFGGMVKFFSAKPTVTLRAVLTVPSSPENFRYKSETSSVTYDGKRVTVIDAWDGLQPVEGVYWGVGESDPAGHYELQMWINGTPAGSYEFDVPGRPARPNQEK